MRNTSARFALIKKTLETEENTLTVKELCQLTKVSRSGYYRWLKAAEKRQKREEKDFKEFQLILRAYQFRGYDKGVRGIHMRLLHEGICMNVKKIRRLMRKYNLFCPIRKPNPYRRMMKELRSNVVAPNHVNREFKGYGARKILLTDITYIPVAQDFCYLSVVIDAYTMQVLSYVLSESLEVSFVLETINTLIELHGITLEEETYIHSDQGSHYTSVKFRELIADKGLIQSMSRRGNCWDNAPQESFFGHMKEELRKHFDKWTSFKEAKASIDDWMDYYNNDRYQINLEKLSPNEYYNYITTGKYPASMYQVGISKVGK